MNKWGTPEDINQAIDLLISNNYITGQVITVDGGRTLF
jgi:NAD(P)-dependent dehydrogenase (short-subunit alcohol dehydrogenase family)